MFSIRNCVNKCSEAVRELFVFICDSEKKDENMIKEAVILAAGEGKRMKKSSNDPYILNTPKPLLKVGGKTIVGRKVEKLSKAGFKVIVVVDKNNLEHFKKELADHNVEYALQGDERGTAAALFAAEKSIHDNLFLVMMGDDVSKLVPEEIKEYDKPTVFGFEIDDVSGYGVVDLNERGEATRIVEKQRSGRGLANTAIYVMPKLFFDVYKDIPKDEKSGEKFLTNAIEVLSGRNLKFEARKIDFWFGINTPEQLKKAQDLFSSGGALYI